MCQRQRVVQVDVDHENNYAVERTQRIRNHDEADESDHSQEETKNTNRDKIVFNQGDILCDGEVDSLSGGSEQRKKQVISLECVGGPKEMSIPMFNIFAKGNREEWAKSLAMYGYGGLYYPCASEIIRSADNRCQMGANSKIDETTRDDTHSYYVGLSRRWWQRKVDCKKCTMRVVKSAIDSIREAQILSLKEALPFSSCLSHVLCTVTNALQAISSETLISATPQLLLSSSQGFSPRFWLDHPCPAYRCFLYLGGENSSNARKSEEQEADCAFVTYGRDMYTTVAKDGGVLKAMSLKGLYLEGRSKFRLSVGDIIVLDGNEPWCVDLPYYCRSPFTRMFTWSLYKSGSPTALNNHGKPVVSKDIPVISPDAPKPLPFYDECLNVSEIRTQYDEHANILSQSILCHTSPFAIDETSNNLQYMERLRLFPALYSSKRIMRELRNSNVTNIAAFL